MAPRHLELDCSHERRKKLLRKRKKKRKRPWKKKKTKVAPTHEFSSSSDRMQENLDKRNVGSAKRLIPAAL
jgi:hypothetical protein